MEAQIQQLLDIIEQQQKTIETLTNRLEDAISEISSLKDLLFNKKSEKMPRVKPKKKVSQKEIQKNRKTKREEQKSLPAEDIRLPVEAEKCVCDCCNPIQFKIIGSKVIERIEFIPSVLRRYKYHIQSKKCLCGKTIVSSEIPANVIDGGKYGPGFHANVVVSKVDDSLPLERQAKILGRAGVEINKSTLCDIFHRSADLLVPIYRHLIDEIQKTDLVNADETRIKLQQPNQCKDAWMWTFLDKEQIIYSFSTSRNGDKVLEILAGSEGLLQSDGYSGYQKGNRERIGCWAHARRYFFKALKSKNAQQYFDWINELYHVEYLAIERDEVGSENHLKLRQLRSKEILEKVKSQLEKDFGKSPPKSPYGRALTYLSNNWDSLQVFLNDARVKLDNNISERALRIIAVGRKNYLFVGTKEAGENLAVLQSLVQTCKLHQVNPQKYLADVLIRIQTHPQSKIAQLHPKNWKNLFSDG